MRLRWIAVLLLQGLAACAGNPAFAPQADFATPSERQMFVALKEVSATDKQRLAAMDAFDDAHARLEKLAQDQDEVLQDWRELDRREPGFSKKASALAKRRADIAQEQMSLSGKFEARLAGTLSEAQWEAWQKRVAHSESGVGPGPRRAGSLRP